MKVWLSKILMTTVICVKFHFITKTFIWCF